MFNGDTFIELKGSSFTPELKRKFVDYFCQNNYFEVFYIEVRNQKVEKDNFYANTAKAFNYLLKLALGYYLNNGLLKKEDIIIQLDERNEKTESKHFLEDYLNTENVTNDINDGNFHVEYFDSANNKLIQIADVFSNLYFSQLKTGEYTEQFDKMREGGYLKHIFKFPL